MGGAMATKLKITTGILALVLLAGCAPKPVSNIEWESFSGKRAYEQAQRLVAYGPRPSSSPALIRTSIYLATQLQEYGLDTEEQVFVAQTPRGPLQFRNVIAKTRTRRGANGPILIVGSHYDTKYMTDIQFVGANDGASSTAVLLEMARVASNVPNLWFVFFDGEECIKEYGANDGLWGSTYFVEELKAGKMVKRVEAMILLDMVGDANLNITMPANSNRTLVQRVFDVAKGTGYRQYFSFGEAATLDDHVPFMKAGIPSVDLIDFQYGSGPGLNDYWHTDKDTLDKISPRSMEIVGQTALRLLDSLRKNPKLN